MSEINSSKSDSGQKKVHPFENIQMSGQRCLKKHYLSLPKGRKLFKTERVYE